MSTKTLTISQAPTAVAGTNVVACSNAAINITEGSSATNNTEITWTSNGTGTIANPTSLTEATYTPGTGETGPVTLTLTATGNSLCANAVSTKTLIISEEVVITKDLDVTSIEVCAGFPVSFSIEATGTGLSYEWTRTWDGVTEIVGTNSPTIEISQVKESDEGTYKVLVKGAGPCTNLSSKEVILVVNQSITFNTGGQPTAEIFSCEGDTTPITISVDVDGTISEYLWRKDGIPLSDGGNISGAMTAELTISNPIPEDSGSYDVVISSPAESCSQIISNPSVVTVNPSPIIESIGENIEVCSVSEEVNITAGAVVSNHSSVLWSVPDGMGTISNANSLTDATFTPAANIESTVPLTLTVKGLEGCSEISSAKNLVIIPQPELSVFTYTSTITDTSAEFCETDTGKKTPIIDGSNLTNGSGIFSVQPEGLVVDPSTGEFTPNGTEPGNYVITYTFVASSNTAVCTEVEKDFEVNIGANPVAAFEYDSTIYCKDTRDHTLNSVPEMSFTEEGHESVDNFTADGAGLALDASTGAIDISASTAGTYKITRTVDYTGEGEDGCQPVTAEFTITISDKPIPDFTYTSTEFCSDPQIEETLNPVMATNATKGAFSFTATPADAVLDLDPVTGEIDLKESAEGIFVIRNTIDTADDGCESVFAEFTITVDKLPMALFSYAGISADKSFCISSLGADLGSSPDTGGTFSITGPSTAVTIDSSTGKLSWTMAEGVAGNYSITYTIPAGTVCEEVSHSETITIDALPVGGDLNFTGVGRVFTTCENAVDGYASPLVLTGETGQVVEWQYKTATSSTWSIYNSQAKELTGDEVEQLVNNQSTVIRAVISNGVCDAGTFSATAIVSVIPSNIKPSPVKAEPTIVCYGTDISLSSKTGYGESFGYFEGGDFTNAGIKNNGWNFTDPSGKELSFDANADSGTPIHWHKTQPKWKFSTADINTNAISEMWWNPLSDGKTNEHFAIAQSTYDSNMDTPPFTLTGMDEAVVTFDQAYNLTAGAIIRVVLLQNGVEIKELDKVTGPASSGNYEGFGDGTPGVNQMSYDLGSYLGESGLSVRFEYRGERLGDIWAVDNIKVPEGPQGVLLQWFYDDNPDDPYIEQIGQDNEEVVSFTPRKIGWNDFEVKTALLLDSNGNACESLDNSERVRIFVFDTYQTTVEVIPAGCGSYSATLNASISGALQGDDLNESEVTFDGYRGEWKIVGPDGMKYTLKNQNEDSGLEPAKDPNIIFESENFAEFSITWELIPTAVYPEDYPVEELRGDLIENPACPPVSIPVTPEFTDCTTLDFDGDDDVIVINNPFTEAEAFEAWILPEILEGTIISSPSFEVKTPTSGISANGRWYHLAVIFGGDESGLYIDGIRAGNAPTGSGGGTRTSIGAKWTSADDGATDHFSGWIEEVRIWKNAPTLKEIQFMMNQRLKLNGTAVDSKVVTPLEGEIVPNKTIAGSYYTEDGFNLDEYGDAFYDQTAADLYAYYRLISEIPDPELGVIPNTYKPVDGNTPDLSLSGIPGRLHNMETHQENTSPTPYFSRADGVWQDDSTWARPLVWDYPDSGAVEWNIARVLNNVHSEVEIKMLGIDVSNTGKLDMRGKNPTKWETGTDGEGNPLYISHYLLLNGIIDLNGESQLLQPHGSIVDGASKGYLDRDQQGTASSYNYNYWVSPVGPDGSNSDYSVGGVMMDGSNPSSPLDLDFGPTYYYADAEYTGRKKISEYWLHKFYGTANDYFTWEHIGSDGVMKAGEGFSMKGTLGSAEIWETQNYIFRGLPNNGNINPRSTVGDVNYLIGNPYPSAIDAHKFIADNLAAGHEDGDNVFNGTIYFWSHFANRTHYLEEYVGGYAAFNLGGGVKAVAVDERINANDDEGGEMPQQFIPVGQAFFINTVLDSTLVATMKAAGLPDVSGGKVIFQNSQRVFAPENGSKGGSVFHSQEKKGVATAGTNNASSQEVEQNKIWLKFKSPKGYHRQILVTADQRATENFDLGFDAPMIDENVEDMYWYFNKYQFVIQGVPDFNIERVLDLGINVEQKGALSISIDDLDNIPDEMNIYLADSLNQVVHDLRAEPYETESEPGTFTDRFKLVFQDKTQIEEPEVPIIEDGPFEVLYVTGTRNVLLRNPELLQVDRVYLNNMLGQQVHVYYNVPSEKEVELPVKRFSAGVYIVKVHYEGGILTRKVILE